MYLHIIYCVVRFYTRNQLLDFDCIHMIGMGRHGDETIFTICGLHVFSWINEWMRLQRLLNRSPVQKQTHSIETSVLV
jgi:hypothetical protein